VSRARRFEWSLADGVPGAVHRAEDVDGPAFGVGEAFKAANRTALLQEKQATAEHKQLSKPGLARVLKSNCKSSTKLSKIKFAFFS
jgi:hypothetical protein